MRTQTAKSGFTMIELLVVVLILAIIITVVIHVSQTVIARGKAETTRKDMQLVLLGIEAFAETDTINNPPRFPPAEATVFPSMNGAPGTRDAAFLPPTTDSDNDWMAFLRAKKLSEQIVGYTDLTLPPPNVWTGNIAAKTKVANAPTALFNFNYKDGATTVNRQQPLFVDAYGKYMDYSSSKGVGSTPVLISAGPDGKFGNEDDIRSDRR